MAILKYRTKEGTFNSLTNVNVIPTTVVQIPGNSTTSVMSQKAVVDYINSVTPTEIDPVFTASAASGITSQDITNWNNKTSNTGTVTGVKINGTTQNPNDGVVDLGTIITSHQDISGKANSSDLATVATSGSYNDLSDKPDLSEIVTLAEAVNSAFKTVNSVVVLDNDDTTNNTTSFASVCSITGAANNGKMETIIYKNETEDIVDENENTIASQQDLYIIIPSNFITPNGSQIVLLCPSGGYCEVNYLNIGGTIYARGL